MRRPALNGAIVASASLLLGVAALGPSALADRNPRVSSIDYVDCDDIRGWVLPRFTGCRGDGPKSIEATLVRCSDLKRDVAATLSECVIDTRGGGKSAGKGGTGGGNGSGNDGGNDNGGGGGKGPSASASAGGSGSTATATSGSGPKASASAGPGGATGSASGGSGSVSTP